MPAPAPHLGILLPTREMAITGSTDARPLIDFAIEAESLGVDSLWAGDSLTARPRLEPLLVLSAVASVTSRIGLGTAAYTPALRNPMVAAALITSLDYLSGRRLVLGVGSGFPVPETEQEFAAAGVPFTGRTGRLDETVALWRQAWREGSVPDTFTGRHVRGTAMDRLLRPARPGGPPLWLAGSDTPAVLRRVARHYDGWLPYLPSADDYLLAWQRIRELLPEEGRHPDAVTPGFYATVTVNRDEHAARAELEEYIWQYYRRPLPEISRIQALCYGSPEKCADWISGYLRGGARCVIIRIGSLTPHKHLSEIAGTLCASLR